MPPSRVNKVGLAKAGLYPTYYATLRLSLPFWLLFAGLTFWVQDNAFFWDTLSQASRRAHWYYEHNFQFFFLSPELDSGHPVFFNRYIARCWQVFGKSLPVSHWAVFPFLMGVIWQLGRLVNQFLPDPRKAFGGMLVLVSIPFFIGHSVLVSPDLVLLFGFFWG